MVQRTDYGWEWPLENFLMLICKCAYTSNPAFGRVDIDPRGACWRAELQNDFRGMLIMTKNNMRKQLTLLGAALTLLLGFGVAQANTYIVTTTADTNDGSCTASLCSLRDAINAANGDTGADTINFSIPVSTNPGCVSARLDAVYLFLAHADD